MLALTRLFIQFTLIGLIEAKSSITSPIQEAALRDTLKITENHYWQTGLTSLTVLLMKSFLGVKSKSGYLSYTLRKYKLQGL